MNFAFEEWYQRVFILQHDEVGFTHSDSFDEFQPLPRLGANALTVSFPPRRTESRLHIITVVFLFFLLASSFIKTKARN